MSEPSSPGDEFEPTAEMMVNDFDDERTLDEEEAMEDADDLQNELSNLEKEKDMPLAQLMAKYGYPGVNDGSQPSSSEEIFSSQDLTLNKKEIRSDILGNKEEAEENQNDIQAKEKLADDEEKIENDNIPDVEVEDNEVGKIPSMLHELYSDHPTSHSGNSRHLRSGSEEEEEDEEDGDYNPEEEDDWKKTIMVGSDYQAVIPDNLHKYGDTMPYENEDKLLWSPSVEENVKDYLSNIQNIQAANVNDLDFIPKGYHVRDDEQALYLLLQCGQNTDEALRRQKINLVSTTDTLKLWSEEECRNFETGLRQYGKDFHLIQQNKVQTRSVSELVQFYYLWKKTELHDVFANKARLEKKEYTLHPGTTDFMEKFLDEQESPSPGSSPNVHSLLSSDPKRQTRTPPPVDNQKDPETESI